MQLWQKSIGIFVLVFFLACPSGLAQRQEWTERSFPFSTVNDLLMENLIYVEPPQDEIDALSMQDYYRERSSKISKVSFRSREAVERAMFMKDVLDLDGLREKDPDGAERAFSEALPRYAELRIQPTVETYHVEKSWQEPYSYTTTEYHDFKIKDNGKEKIISIPETVVHEVPGRYIYTGYVKVKFEVYDTKSGKLVYMATDSRSAEKECIDMYKRIVNDFYAGLKKVLKK